jgi:hypothetical protein
MRFFWIIIILAILNSCSKKEILQTQDKQINKTTIKENISIVLAKIVEKNKISDSDYHLRLLILESKSDLNFPNFAIQYDTLKASPLFYLDETGQINLNDERNKNLLRLSYANVNNYVELKLTYIINKGWFIIDYLNKQ